MRLEVQSDSNSIGATRIPCSVTKLVDITEEFMLRSGSAPQKGGYYAFMALGWATTVRDVAELICEHGCNTPFFSYYRKRRMSTPLKPMLPWV